MKEDKKKHEKNTFFKSILRSSVFLGDTEIIFLLIDPVF